MTTIRQTIYDLCAISEDSNIPILIMSNPGYAKTTCIKDYAKEKGYCLETLIGSRYEANDISGYSVNEPGEKNLVHKEPTWFTRIKNNHKEGKKTLLFIDELSTCRPDVQGTLLTLIFDRTIGEGKFLPNDTVIISAANYANNLNEEFDIISPTLNRFCVFNLLEDKTTNDILDEFLTDKYLKADLRSVNEKTVVEKETFSKNFYDAIRSIFFKHNNNASSLGVLDLKNTNFQDLYRANDKVVLNIITGRSLNRLKNILYSTVKLSILDRDIINGLVDGLVGAGTCSFKEDSQLDNYRKEIKESCIKLCTNSILKEEIKIVLPDSLIDSIDMYINATESKSATPEYILGMEKKITDRIYKEYGNSVSVVIDLKSLEISDKDYKDKGFKFITFYDCLSKLLSYVKDDDAHSKLCDVHQSLMCVYNDLMGTSYTFKDFIRQYGLDFPKCCDKCFVAKLTECFSNPTEFGKVAVLGGNTYIYIKEGQTPCTVNLGNIITMGNIEQITLKRL